MFLVLSVHYLLLAQLLRTWEERCAVSPPVWQKLFLSPFPSLSPSSEGKPDTWALRLSPSRAFVPSACGVGMYLSFGTKTYMCLATICVGPRLSQCRRGTCACHEGRTLAVLRTLQLVCEREYCAYSVGPLWGCRYTHPHSITQFHRWD